MKLSLLVPVIAVAALFAACQAEKAATPIPPLTIIESVEFTLAPDQTAAITEAGLTIQLIGVAGDERCPSEIECAASGPVSISLSVQMSNGEPANLNLQTFTDNDGRAPDMEFEGIEDRVVYEGYLIRVAGVWPYPTNLTETISDSEYRVTLVVSR